MKTSNNKLKYTIPKVVRIEIDKEISLVLESTPPVGPNEEYLKVLESTKGDPFKMNIG